MSVLVLPKKEYGETPSDTENSSCPNPLRPKKKKYEQKFKKNWTLDPDLCSWLVEYPPGSAYCKSCDQEMREGCNRFELIRHGQSFKHRENHLLIRFAMCRICFKEKDEKYMPSIYAYEEATGEMKVYEKLNLVGNIGIPLDSVPDKICNSCLTLLNTAFAFRTMCQMSAKRFSNANTAPVAEPAVELEPEPERFLQVERKITEPFMQMDQQITAPVAEPEPERKNVFDPKRFLQVDIKNIKEELTVDCTDDEDVPEVILEEDNSEDVNMEELLILNKKPPPKSEAEVIEIEPVDVDRFLLSSIAEDDALVQPESNTDVHEDKIEWKLARPTPELKKVDKNRFICDVCGNVYDKRFKLNDHLRRHQNIKPHECEICQKKFSQSGDLKNHMRVHTGEKPFQCIYCGRRFADRSSKVRHERAHRNERPYACGECGKAFTYTASLNKHKKIHTGEKAFPCLVCGKRFVDAPHLKTHLKTNVHRRNVELQQMKAARNAE